MVVTPPPDVLLLRVAVPDRVRMRGRGGEYNGEDSWGLGHIWCSRYRSAHVIQNIHEEQLALDR